MKKSILALVILVCGTLYLQAQTQLSAPPHKGHGYIGIRSGYAYQTSYFNSSGSYRQTLPTGFKETYHLISLEGFAEYGLSERFSLWFNLPFVYRQETRSFDISTLGLGDITAGVRARLLSPADFFHIYGTLHGTFPSGNTMVDYEATQGIQELPLGKGVSEIIPGLTFLENAGNFIFMQEMGYAFSLENTVSYLYTTPILAQQDSVGTVVVSPAGNLTIDWGDTLFARLHQLWKATSRFNLFFDARYFYRFKTYVQDYTYVTSGANIDSQISNVSFSPSQLLALTLGASLGLSDYWKLGIKAEYPVWGRNYPLPRLAYAESMLGPKASVELRYEF